MDRALWCRPPQRTRWRHLLFLSLVGVSVATGLFAALHLLTPSSAVSYFATGILIFCFTLLFAWIASNFWAVVFGAGRLLSLKRRCARGAAAGAANSAIEEDARTAVAIPVYNEDAAMVAGNVEAMLTSLEAEGALELFDFYILSDSSDPKIWLREEQAWLALACRPAFRSRVFYRRRKENPERKSGNLKQFLENWGHEYRYMLVLDADSVVSGATMVELMRRMEADPKVGLLQTWPRTAGGTTLFARMHQYAAGLYGRIQMCGIADLINPHGNYWGHNAIIRVGAFMDCCGLPRLPGKEPLGGEILSHDFVEAALLVRRGWKVELVPDLEGSYEESPPNVVQHVARDQRWCQGNLQHFWVMLARGIHPVSRVNLLTGILAYLASPLWLLFVLVAAVMALSNEMLFSTGLVLVRNEVGGWVFKMSAFDSVMALLLLGMTVTFILAPKLIGAALALFKREENPLRLACNVLAEMALSILVAPTIMLRHSIFVLRVLFAEGVKWSPQQRDAERLGWGEAWRAFGGQTLLGAGIAASALLWPSMVHIWLSPILLGLTVSIPLAVLTGRVPMGAPLVLAAPEDRNPPAILRHAAACRGAFARRLAQRDPFLKTLDDPTANQLRRFMLDAAQSEAGQAETAGSLDSGALLAHAREAPEDLDSGEVEALLDSAAALSRLHLESFETPRGGGDFGPDEGPHGNALASGGSGQVELSQKCLKAGTTSSCSNTSNTDEETSWLVDTAVPSATGREKTCEPPRGTTGPCAKPAPLRDRACGQPDRCGRHGPGIPAPHPRQAGPRFGDQQSARLPLSDPAERPCGSLPEAQRPGRGSRCGERGGGGGKRAAESGGPAALRGYLASLGPDSGRPARDRASGLPGGPVLRGSLGDSGNSRGHGAVPPASGQGGTARDDRTGGSDQRVRQARQQKNGGRGT